MRSDPFRYGTPMRPQRRRAMIRYAIKRKLEDGVIRGVLMGTATIAQVYGRHPTKGHAAA